MLRVRTDHPHNTTSTDNFALTTHTFDRRSYFHFDLISEPIVNSTDKAAFNITITPSIEITSPFSFLPASATLHQPTQADSCFWPRPMNPLKPSTHTVG